MLNVIAVMGTGRKTGKTTTVEALVRELTSHGYRVGTIKQIPKEDFTIDTPNKDTWRHAEAGAKVVVSSAPHEVAAIKRLEGRERFAEAMHLLETENLDLIIVEGNPPADMPRILAARGPDRAKKLLKETEGSTICISSLTPENFSSAEFNIPVLQPVKDAEEMADLLVKYLRPRTSN